MTGSLLDHMLAIILVGAMFVAAVVALPNMGYIGLLSVDQQQLRNVALSALNTMLLDSGYPTDWGQSADFNPASVTRFGLASSSETGHYILDARKVMRLVETDEWGLPNPMAFLAPDTTRRLLGLQNYGFNLTILSPFKAMIIDLAPPINPSRPTDQELRTINYEVTVKFNDGRPIPNAIVYAFIIYSEKTGGSPPDEQYNVRIVKETLATNELGKCSITKDLSGEVSDVLMVLKATVGDIYTVTSFNRRGSPRNDIAIINMVGDDIVLTTPPANPRDQRWILSVHAFTKEGLSLIYNGTRNDVLNWGSMNKWLRTFPGLKYVDPMLLIFSFRAVEKNSGRQGILVVGPFPNYLGSRVLSYSCGGPPTETVTLQRVVIIEGMTYTVDFTIWKKQ